MKLILPLFVFVLLAVRCNYDDKKHDSNRTEVPNSKEVIDNKLPFIGKRMFETREAISGTGTPHRYIEILESGDVYFSFEQENQANGSVTSEKYAAGKFSKYMKSVFKKLDNETRFYEIDTSVIYEVDSNRIRLKSEDCCNSTNFELGSQCPCLGEFITE